MLWEPLLVENMHINDCKQYDYSYAAVRICTIYSGASSHNLLFCVFVLSIQYGLH